MNNRYLNLFLALLPVAQLQAEGNVTIEFENRTLTIPSEMVDLMQSDTLLQKVDISYSATNGGLTTSDTISATDVVLTTEKPQSFNVLSTFSLTKTNNPTLKADIVVELGAQTSTLIVLPYLGSVSNLVPSFQTTGAHIFVDGKLWNEGKTVDFTSPVKVKVAAFNGDVRTYTIVVSKTSLPYVEIKTNSNQTIEKDWVEANLTIDGADEGTLSVKGKGSHYSNGQKNNFALKFEDKKSLLDIRKNKRWLIDANDADKTLFRNQLGFWLSQQLSDTTWTPTSKMVNLCVNGQFMGCYALLEQPRICKGRFEDGYLLTTETNADVFEDAFPTKISAMWLAFEDPETGSKGTGLIRTKDKIDKFEKALKQEDWATVEQYADLASLANWLVINEIAFNTEAFTDNTLIHVADNGKISMLPAWELKKAFGCETDETEGWAASSNLWMSQLLNYSTFKQLVKQQYAKIRQKDAELNAFIDQQSAALSESAVGNNAVWKNLDSTAYGSNVSAVYNAEVERLKSWVNSRLAWLDTQW